LGEFILSSMRMKSLPMPLAGAGKKMGSLAPPRAVTGRIKHERLSPPKGTLAEKASHSHDDKPVHLSKSCARHFGASQEY